MSNYPVSELNTVTSITISLSCDSSIITPLLKDIDNAIEKLSKQQTKLAKKAFQRLLDSGDLFLELTGIKLDNSSTLAGKCIIRLYPSERFLLFASTLFAGDF